jgi:hypothetical protein
MILAGILVAMAVAVTTVGFGFTLAEAQMADNATMGNMTGGNMTMDTGNTTDATGSISGAEDPFQ